MTDLKACQSKWKFRDLPKTYAKLVTWYAPRPIRNEAERQAATAMIDALAGHALNRDQDDYLDLLSTLLSEYEDVRYPIRARETTPLEALKDLMEESGTTAADLGKLLGERTLGSKILRGERELSVNHIALLSEHFAMNPEYFMPKALRPTKARTQAKHQPNLPWRGVARDRVR